MNANCGEDSNSKIQRQEQLPGNGKWQMTWGLGDDSPGWRRALPGGEKGMGGKISPEHRNERWPGLWNAGLCTSSGAKACSLALGQYSLRAERILIDFQQREDGVLVWDCTSPEEGGRKMEEGRGRCLNKTAHSCPVCSSHVPFTPWD